MLVLSAFCLNWRLLLNASLNKANYKGEKGGTMFKGKIVLKNYNHWRKNKVNYFPASTANGILAGNKTKAIDSSDCCADPCSCTGCSQWD